jgi:hypothetical protein
MPFSRQLAIINKYITNRFVLLFAAWIPPLAILEHKRRRTGNIYRTPLLAFPTANGYFFALTYGRDVDWVKNLITAGSGLLRYRGVRTRIHSFSFVSYFEVRSFFPGFVRFFLDLIIVDDCLVSVKQ